MIVANDINLFNTLHRHTAITGGSFANCEKNLNRRFVGIGCSQSILKRE